MLVSVIDSRERCDTSGVLQSIGISWESSFRAAMINCLKHSGYVRHEAGVQFIIAIIAAFSKESESMSMNKDSSMEELEKIKPFQVIEGWEGTCS